MFPLGSAAQRHPHAVQGFAIERVLLPMLLSDVGGKRGCKDREPQPGGRFVSSVRARSVIHVESGINMGEQPPSLFPFALEGFPFPFRIHESSPSESERI